MIPEISATILVISSFILGVMLGWGFAKVHYEKEACKC